MAVQPHDWLYTLMLLLIACTNLAISVITAKRMYAQLIKL